MSKTNGFFYSKVAISAFIVFHWACVLAWLWPNPSVLKSFLMGIGLPGQRQGVAATYLFHTAQHQDWAMFAPNPLQINRYVAATVTYRDGRQADLNLPRLSQLNWLDCWIEKRYRKYQHRLAEEPVAAFREDFARYAARRMADPANPPVRVVVYEYQSPIPRHDRPRQPAWTDYTAILRDHAVFTRKPLLDYAVRDGDLR